MTLLRTQRLILRNWRESDRELFHRINSDDTVMEFFPFRRDRAQADAVMDRVSANIVRDGYGWTAAEVAATGECVGFVGLNPADIVPVVPFGTLEIGWRLAPEYWGQGFVTEAARAWLRVAFEDLGRVEVVSFAVWNNTRSTAVMRRLGMSRDSVEFRHPLVPDSHPELQRHVLYRLSRKDWQRQESPAS